MTPNRPPADPDDALRTTVERTSSETVAQANEALRMQLEKLSSDVVARVHDAVHDLRDSTLRDVCLGILWGRHATVGGDWPQQRALIGSPNGDCDDVRGEHWLILCCRHARTPKDPQHQPARSLAWSYHRPGDLRSRKFDDTQCACGRRLEQNARLWQAHPNARVWPVVIRDGVHHFQVCKFSRGADDAAHAPDARGVNCLCGALLGRHNLDGTDQFLPAQ